jgi:hypothetical protein
MFPNITLGQGRSALVPILTWGDWSPGNLVWSSDGRQILMLDIANPDDYDWYIYNPASESVGESENGAYLELPERCGDQTQAYADTLSPNGNFLLYVRESLESGFVRPAIADCDNEQTFVFPDWRRAAYRVVWSADSSAFYG